ncbi:MAG: hypothetical protein QOI93_1882 [Rhodospirillaceae bacterium]|jgi:hypothetical protein|nr:hypothetical protein [Rhodospirillaceae bacterium]HEV7544525.1 DUF2950 domain-containing protein [Reyranella sp.]
MSMFPRSLIVILALLAGFAGIAFAQADKQQRFPSAEAAATTLTEAIRKDDDKAIAAILGTGWRDLVPGNKTHEDEARTRFLESWDQGHKIVPQGDDKAIIEAGTTGWQMPIPLVKDAAGWRYDVEAGAKEIVAREIGRDELAVIQVLLAIVDAQREYATLDPKKTGGTAYARRLLSSPGKKDGLYWEAAPGEPQSPLGALVAKAQPGDGPGQGYFGYHFRLLYGQGAAAPGGAHDYLVNNRMIGGFGVIAWPVTYGETGVMTFIVSQAGDVYEQDLGPETAQRAGSIVLFNPDKGWDKADMTPP